MTGTSRLEGEVAVVTTQEAGRSSSTTHPICELGLRGALRPGAPPNAHVLAVSPRNESSRADILGTAHEPAFAASSRGFLNSPRLSAPSLAHSAGACSAPGR
jgi:hypothetical protein